MKQELEQILRSYGILTDAELSEGLRCFIPAFYKKNDILIEAGRTCDWIAFVNSGILRNYYMSSKEEEVSYCLSFPHTFITAYSSFISNKSSFETIHAVTDSEVLIIRKYQYLKLIDSSINWLKFSHFFAEQSYVLMENRLLTLQMESAEKRYEDLITNHPEYIQHIPLKHLASYLGITQRHLSRLRKNMSF